jgi:regulatory protein YycI of two-component signal transduction system YycFG
VDWSKIKTIFILTFLALDIYLLYEFLKIRDSNKYEIVAETSFEEELSADQIKYVELPKNPIKEMYVSANSKKFSKEEFAKLKDQQITIIDDTLLHSVLTKPVKLLSDYEQTELIAFINNKILYGDQYQFWEKDEQQHTITYYQKYKNKTLYNNINGKLVLYLNDKNEVISYKQTFLEEIEGLSGKQEILPALKAIEALYDNGDLKRKSKITKAEIGYYTLVQLTASQVLTPTWRFVVDEKENLFVNAFEGQIIEMDNKEKK